MSERNFFAELKRRNVYKVAVAYAVVAWHADAQTGRDGETVYCTTDFTVVARWVNSSLE